MIYEQCIKLKKLIVEYNRKQSTIENCLHYEFDMFQDGEWACTLKCDGCVDVLDFKPIYDFIATLFVVPFMWGNQFGFRVNVQ